MSIDQPMAVHDHVVVGVDGSEPSKHALRWALFLAQATDRTVEAVAVWEPLMNYGWLGAGFAYMPPDWNPVDIAEEALGATVDEVFAEHRPPELELTVLEGNPAQVLLERSTGARMLVVGSRGHGGFAGLLLGSVSTACTAHAICPVLVLHGNATPPPVRPQSLSGRTP